MKRLSFAVWIAALCASPLACTKPKPPELTPQEVAVTSVDVAGFDVRTKMEAFNPNGFAIAVRKVVAHVVVNGTEDLGTTTSSTPISLPANGRTQFDVPLRATWKSALVLASLAQTDKPIPFTVDGTVTIGGESLNVDLPFKLESKMTPEQIRRAVANSLRGIPGLPDLLPVP